MKKILVVGLILVSGLNYAGETEKAELSLNLSLNKLCSDNSPVCSSASFKISERLSIILEPQDGTVTCTVDECTRTDVTRYRGIWSSVVENDGVRSIAIVSIDKEQFSSGDIQGSLYINYTITAEILGTKGTEAKLVISVDDLNKLNGTTLEAPVQNIYGGRYQASLYIASSRRVVSMPLPCRPGDVDSGGKSLCDDYQREDVNKFFNPSLQLELVLGSIR